AVSHPDCHSCPTRRSSDLDIATNIVSGFNMTAKDTGRVSDVLAKAAASANTSVEQLGAAMSYVAPVAAGAGISLEETAAAIGIRSEEHTSELQSRENLVCR